MVKMDAAAAPLVELRENILCQERRGRRPADELVLFRVRLGRNEREHPCAVGRSNGDPPVSGRQAGICGQPKPELVQVETQASILVADENGNRVQTQVEIPSIGFVASIV